MTVLCEMPCDFIVMNSRCLGVSASMMIESHKSHLHMFQDFCKGKVINQVDWLHKMTREHHVKHDPCTDFFYFFIENIRIYSLPFLNM